MTPYLSRLTNSPEIVALLIGIFVLIGACGKEINDKSFWKGVKNFWKQIEALFLVLLILLAVILHFELIDYQKHLRFISFIMGLLVTLSLGALWPIIRDHITKDIVIELPTNMGESERKKIIKMSEGGKYIGIFERILYYIAFVILWENATTVIAAIVGFKVAAKWETWKNIVQVPRGKSEGFPDDISSFLFRRRWGESVLIRFVVGTFSNILYAVIGFGFYSWFLKTFDP